MWRKMIGTVMLCAALVASTALSAQDNTEHYFGADDVCAQTRVKLGLMHVSPLGPLESVGDGTSVRVQGTHVSGYVSVEKLVTRDISDSRYNIAYVRQYWINEAPENSLVHVGHTQYLSLIHI